MRLRWLSCRRLLAALVVLTSVCATLSLLRFSGRDITPSNPVSEHQLQDLLRQAETSNADRLLRVQTVCRKYNLGLYRDTSAPPAFKHPPTPQYSVFYIDLIHKVALCPVYKAASTSWLYNLCLLGGYQESQLAESNRTQQLSVLARKVFPELDYPQAEEALQNSLKLLVVRHPFERLLSAYRDKLENTNVGREHGTEHFYRKYGARIVAKYRRGGNLTRTSELLPPGSYYWASDQPLPSGVEPTFREFVRYLIDLDLLSYSDDHWIPVYLFCTPCLLRYDIIAKVETLQRDQVYTLRAANIDQLIRPRWQHRTVPAGTTTSDLARRYFSQLTTADVQKLYQKYQLDFELFGYKIDDYLKYTSDFKEIL
uniref:Carbohydrate sulfotransferase n=1 Tax=Graphocephala atropunctata TaxID=36148 RepID=A0A1B6L286_9HEMI